MNEQSIDLFGVSGGLTTADMAVLEGTALLLRRVTFQLHAKGTLEPVLRALVRAGKAKTFSDAIRLLGDLVTHGGETDQRIAAGDFKGGRPRALLRLEQQLAKMAGDEKGAPADSYFRRHGTISHVAVPEFLRGALPTLVLHGGQDVEQLRLGFLDDGRQLDLFTRQLLNEVGIGFTVLSGAPGNLNPRFVRALKGLWRRTVAQCPGGIPPVSRYPALASHAGALRQMLAPVFGDYLRRLVASGNAITDYLSLLTLMSWATAVLHGHSAGRRPFFREVPVLGPYHGMGGGRVDAIEVVAIDGKVPTRLQRVQLATLTRLEPAAHRSVGWLLHHLERYFRQAVTVRLIDWKFSVGDAVTPSSVIEPSEVAAGPLARHVSQVQQYLTLAALDYHLSVDGASDGWLESPHFREAVLVYFFPTAMPVTHVVPVDTVQRELVLREGLAYRFLTAFQRAELRTYTNDLVASLLALFDGNGGAQSRLRSRLLPSSAQLSLIDRSGSTKASEVVHRYRRFVDEHRILEVVGKWRDGGDMLVCHLDRLQTAIQERAIATEHGFSWDRGGKILCPVHREDTPSFYVNLRLGYTKCFGCGAFARIAEGSVPSDLTGVVRPLRREPIQGAVRKVLISERQRMVVGIAQVLLQSYFRGSVAERYLERDRGLNANLAYACGAGFYDEARFLNDILDMRVEYDELLRFGFLGVSDRIPLHRSSVVEVLRSRGMPVQEISRPVGKGNGVTSDGIPYSVLHGRLTFPLTIEGVWVNIYGRDVLGRDRRFAHRKLFVRSDMAPHGPFNEAVLSGDADEVLVTEAPIDVLSLIEMGHRSAMAMVGVKNFMALELIRRSGKRVGVALDNDAAGQNATYGIDREETVAYGDGKVWQRRVKVAGLMDWFRENGVAAVRDFTADFVREHARDAGWKDWNDYWRNVGMFQQGVRTP